MTTQSTNLTNSSVSLLSNNSEWLSKIQKKIREQAKLDVFKNLDLDKRWFTDIQETISEIKALGTDDKINIGRWGYIKYETLKSKDPYKAIFENYNNSGEKEKMYMEIAERIILNRWWVVEYKDWQSIWKDTINEKFVKDEYEILNKEYNNKLDFFTLKDEDWRLYIIKRKADELRKIKERENELKDEEIEKLQKEKGNLKESSTKESEWKNNKELDNEKKDSEEKNNEEKDNEKEKMEALIKKLMDDSEKKDKRITELEKLLKNKKSDKEAEDNNEKVIDEEDNKNNDELENSEALDENSNYISRSFVEWLIFGIRWAEWYPKWTIRIREEVINVEEFEFYEEFKQEYIEAKWDATKLSRLDKEFAEMIILFSPKWADYNNKYCIKLSESELKDGLYVSEERLAHYGVMIKISDYFEKIVEREVIRERRIVEQIETTITELKTQIVELTTSISIEDYNRETILKEIKSKKELLAILIKRYKALQLSLKWLDSDEELKHLKEDEKKLQEELKELKELKKQKDVFNEIEKALDSMPKDEFICIKTKDWKTGWFQSIWEKFSRREDHTGLFENIKNDGAIKKSQLLEILQKSDNVKEIIIWQENMPKKPQKFSIPENINDIDTKIADIEKQLVDIKEKIKQKEANNKKRMSLWEFDIWENWYLFRDYCKRNWIKRKDWKSFDENNLESDYLDVEYVDKDGRTLKLEYINWAEDDWYDNPQTKAEFVYYEESWNWEWNELESQLNILIEEWETLLIELTKLEKELENTDVEEEKVKIKKRIETINQKLIMISQKYTKFEQFIHTYKSRTTIKKYKIFQIIPSGPIPVPNKPFEMTSVISDMGTDVFKEKAALKVEEELKRQYKSLWRWQMWSRLALFLWRWSKRKKMMKKEMNNMANTAFQTNAAYATLNEQSQNAADRHSHELLTNMAAVNRITTVHNDEIDKLCKDYLNNLINDDRFQQRFNTIVAADTNIQNALNGQNITHIGTNILLQLKEQKALNTLIHTLDWQLTQYITTGNTVYMHNMQNYVEQYIKDYQKLPVFKATFEQFVNWNLNARNQLRRYLAHQKAIINMQITNLRMNIDIVNKWKSAYQIDNKDREKWWKYKVGHFMDKHPWWTAIGSVALWVWLWVATAPLSAVAWAAVTTWVFGSYVWFTNYVKKWTHHTKEQNTHEKNVVTDYRNEQAKIQNWQNLALNGKGWKKYKAKRQLALYDQTTQENIKLSDQITEYITNLSAKTGPLTADEDNFMRLNLIEWWARLKYYRIMWHNFLASENIDKTEKDMKRLEKAITLWLQKIWKNTNDIEQNMTATNPHWTNITYAVIQNDLKASYDKSLIQFKRERRWLALRYGIWTAALSIGTALGLQYITWTWIWSKWTPPTAPTTTSYNWWTDNFGLWKSDIPWTASFADSWNVYTTSKSIVSGAPAWSTVNFTYWVWTDAVPVIPGHLTSTDLATQISTVKANINAMSWPTMAANTQRQAFIDELNSLASSWFTNDNLATMRAAEYLEHCAQAMSDAWMANSDVWSLTPTFTRALDASGWTYNNLAERFMTWAIDVTTPGKPWTDPVKRWRWLMWVPLFFNTFKDRKSTKDTTDQNFWKWNDQKKPQQPNQEQDQDQPHNP